MKETYLNCQEVQGEMRKEEISQLHHCHKPKSNIFTSKPRLFVTDLAGGSKRAVVA